MKITTSSANINSFGGLNFIHHEINKLGIPQLAETHLGTRPEQAKFSYSDIIVNYLMLLFAGGHCAEDIGTHLKKELTNVDGLNVSSPDTLLHVQRNLATPKEIKLSPSGVNNEINTHPGLLRLNLALLLYTKSLCPGEGHTLDFDNQFLPCNKYDSRKGYKMEKGYFPSVGSINNHIVYLENRNGNSNVKFGQAQTLAQMFEMLLEHGIKIAKARMDCGSFTKEIIEAIEKYCSQFYVRAQRCAHLYEVAMQSTGWRETRINHQQVEVCSIGYKPFGGEKSYRYVITREKKKTNQGELFEEGNYTYRAIITNDYEMGEEEVIHFYNQRGCSEKIFDEMNNDFGWSRLPFSFMNQNTVYMMIMAICRNLYLYLIGIIAKKTSMVQKNFRLRKFIFRFVIVPCKWIKKGGQKTLKLFTSKPYHLLLE